MGLVGVGLGIPLAEAFLVQGVQVLQGKAATAGPVVSVGRTLRAAGVAARLVQELTVPPAPLEEAMVAQATHGPMVFSTRAVVVAR